MNKIVQLVPFRGELFALDVEGAIWRAILEQRGGGDRITGWSLELAPVASTFRHDG